MQAGEKICTHCGRKGRFHGNVCRICRRGSEGNVCQRSSSLWRLINTIIFLGGVALGGDLVRHTEMLAVPMILVACALANDILLGRRAYIPRSVRRLVRATLRWGARAQVGAFMLMIGLCAGLGLHYAGFDAYVHDPITALQDSDKVRAQEAANDFAENKPGMEKTLSVIQGLIDKSNLSMAESRLRDLDGQMAPLRRSYAKDFADVQALQKQVDALRVTLGARRQSLAINEALTAMSELSQRLDQVDTMIARHRFDLASHLWVRVDKDIENVTPPAAVSERLDKLRVRLENQRDEIRRGFEGGLHAQVHADPGVSNKKPTAANAPARARDVQAVDE